MGGTPSSNNHDEPNPELQKHLMGYSIFERKYHKTVGNITLYKKNGEHEYRAYGRMIFDIEQEARDFLADLRQGRQLAHLNIAQIVWVGRKC